KESPDSAVAAGIALPFTAGATRPGETSPPTIPGYTRQSSQVVQRTTAREIRIARGSPTGQSTRPGRWLLRSRRAGLRDQDQGLGYPSRVGRWPVSGRNPFPNSALPAPR